MKQIMIGVVALLLCAGQVVLAGDELTIVVDPFPPFAFSEPDGVTGIDVEVARRLLDQLGVKYTITLLPWARGWKLLMNGEADVGLIVSKKTEREAYVAYPVTSVWDSSYVFFTNIATKAACDVRSYADVKKCRLKVGVVREMAYNDAFWEAFPWQDAEKKVYYPLLDVVRDAEINLNKLEANRIQIFPMDKIMGAYTARQLNLTQITRYDFTLFAKPYFTVFSKASHFQSDRYPNIAALMAAYDEALAALKLTPEFQAIFERYIGAMP